MMQNLSRFFVRLLSGLLLFLLFPPGSFLRGGDAVFRHAPADEQRIRRSRFMSYDHVAAGRQRRPAEYKPFNVAAELFVALMDDRPEREQ